MDSPSHSQLLAYTLQLEQQQEREQQQQQQEEENEQYVMDNNLHGGEHSNLSFNFKVYTKISLHFSSRVFIC